jgi:hypothetical protein
VREAKQVTARTCSATNKNGEPCGASPLQDDEFCFLHSPKTAKEAAEARHQGGVRKRREKVVSTVYDFEGLRSVEDIQRFLEIIAVDTLTQDNSPKRSQAGARIASIALQSWDRGELLKRLETLEAARGVPPRRIR